ncbi:hypothetical protein COCON_G00024690 [Conger conger]|uniref:Interleukin-2 receptor subunit beta n=1 Tax=Conger conger TaxID=82655 RepID=A0A9Q1I5Q9_CONCO|nr:hypothetical protein COCON_G00024690 [Conger conger]
MNYQPEKIRNEHVKAAMVPLWFPLFLLFLSPLHSSHTHQDLRCLNDYINKVTCVWDSRGTLPDTVCILHGTFGKSPRLRKESCDLKPLNEQNPALRGCPLVFTKRKIGLYSTIELHVSCENMTSPVAQIQDYKALQHIRLNPPDALNVTNYTISWDRTSQEGISHLKFQLQFKQEEQSWEDVNVKTVVIQDQMKQLQLPHEDLEVGRSYQVRVRVDVHPKSKGYASEWSRWSPVKTWRSEVGREPPQPTGTMDYPKRVEKWLIGCGAALLVVLVALSMTFPIRYIRVDKAILKPVPTPAKYFDVLNSTHGGNFQKWLGPVMPAQYFDVPQHSVVSQVDLISAEDSTALFRKEGGTAPEEQDVSGQSPSFSNLSYFYSSYPRQVDTLPPACSSGQPAQGPAEPGKDGRAEVARAGSIRIVSSYECLQKLIARRGQPMHQDSGISVGSEDQDTGDDEGDGEAEDEGDDVQNDAVLPSDPSVFHPFLFPFGKSPFQEPYPQHLSAFPHFPFPLPHTGAGGLIEPCSDEYMPVKNIHSSSPDKSPEGITPT